MERQKSRSRWVISVAVIAIIVPVSVMTLLLNGFFSSATPECLTAETVTWEIERPSEMLDIHQVAENIYTNEEASLNLTVYVDGYDEQCGMYGGHDSLPMSVYVAAKVGNGFVKNVNIAFYNDTQPSQVDLFEWSELGQFENLSLIKYSHGWPSEQYVKASANLTGINNPSKVYFNAPTHWILRTANDKSHHLTVTSEITYYNGTAYKRVVLPIMLRVIADAGNSFETARTISFGNHTAFIHWGDDPEDYYKIWLDTNQVINIQLSMPRPSAGLCLDLYLYSPDGILVANSSSRKPDSIEQITYIINQSGNWYIQVLDPYAGYTLYALSIEAEQP
jgi:hypothetical protein